MILRELTVGQAGKPFQINEETGVIEDVKIIGNKSANGRTYRQDVLEKARGLYEGRQVNLNHTDADGKRDRSVEDRIGRFVNVRAVGEGLVGNFEYLKTHPFSPRLVEIAKRMPEQFGMSHNAEGRVKNENGSAVVEEIISVKSVDLVSDPATTRSLFESLDRQLTAEALVEKLEAEAHAAGVVLRELMDGGTMLTDMPTIDGSLSADEQINLAFEAMIVAAWRDRMLDRKATLKKFGDILDARERLMGSTKKPPERTTPALMPEGDAGVDQAEFDKLKEKVRLSEARDEARELLETAEVPATKELLETLVLLPTTEARKRLIESWPKGAGDKGDPTPRSAPKGSQTVQESKAPCDTTSLDKTAAYLFGRG